MSFDVESVRELFQSNLSTIYAAIASRDHVRVRASAGIDVQEDPVMRRAANLAERQTRHQVAPEDWEAFMRARRRDPNDVLGRHPRRRASGRNRRAERAVEPIDLLLGDFADMTHDG